MQYLLKNIFDLSNSDDYIRFIVYYKRHHWVFASNAVRDVDDSVVVNLIKIPSCFIS